MSRSKPEAISRSGIKGKLYRGFMDELVRDAGRGPLTVWMLAWRCKRCGHCWPVRKHRQAHDGKTTTPGAYLVPKVGSTIDPTRLPKKCPGCDSDKWWQDYSVPLKGPQRRGLRRRPVMLKQYREGLAAEQAEAEGGHDPE